jgi:hypothetical protein
MSVLAKEKRDMINKESIIVQIKENYKYLLFSSFLLVFFLFHLYLTMGLNNQRSKEFPQLVIYGSILVTLIGIVAVLLPKSGAHTGDSEDQKFSQTEGKYSSPPIQKIAVQFAWIIGYIAGIRLLGFFSFTAFWAFFYTFYHSDGSLTSRILSAVISSMFITGFVWILFVYLLQVSSVFRLGIFI